MSEGTLSVDVMTKSIKSSISQTRFTRATVGSTLPSTFALSRAARSLVHRMELWWSQHRRLTRISLECGLECLRLGGMSRPHELCTEKSLGIREGQTSLREARAREYRGEEKPRPAGIDDQTDTVWLLEHVLNLSALLGHPKWSALFRMRQSIPQDVFFF